MENFKTRWDLPVYLLSLPYFLRKTYACSAVGLDQNTQETEPAWGTLTAYLRFLSLKFIQDVSFFFFRFLQTSSFPFQIFADPFCPLLLSPIVLKICIWRKETSILSFSTNVIKLEIKDPGEKWLKLWDSLALPVTGISSTHPTAESPRLTLIPNKPALGSRKLMLFVCLSHHSVTNSFHELGLVT